MPNAITVKCTAAFMLDGQLVRPGEIVELTKNEASNLLHRGRVELVDADALAAPDVLSTGGDAEADDKPARRARKKAAEAE